MKEQIVTTQAELDAALAAGAEWIEIRSHKGVWLEISNSGSASVIAFDSASVSASGSASVRASGSASVRAFGSASVIAFGSASVSASGSASVRASGSASVRATGSASVRATDSASVIAFGSASVIAFDSASVSAFDSASVIATPLVAVHVHNSTVHVTGGTILDHTKVESFTPAEWCEYHGVTVADGIATVYKAVNDKWTTDRGFDYSPGATPSAPDWKPTAGCGNGLHFGPTPHHALAYYEKATRFVACGVKLDTLVPIHQGTAKCKAPAVVVPCVEVTIDGELV